MPEEAPDTKQKLLDVSKQLMMAKGYNATTVEEICKLAEVTKGAFFYYFKTKEALGVSVLKDYWQTRQRQFADTGWMIDDDPRQQIQSFLEAVAEIFASDPNGYTCLAGSFTQELATTNPLFRQQVSELFDEWTAQIKPILRAAKDLAPSQDEIDIDVLADHIVTVVEGALILALARQDRSVIFKQVGMLNSHIQSLFLT